MHPECNEQCGNGQHWIERENMGGTFRMDAIFIANEEEIERKIAAGDLGEPISGEALRHLILNPRLPLYESLNARVRYLEGLVTADHKLGSVWDPMLEYCGTATQCSCGKTFCAPYGDVGSLQKQYDEHKAELIRWPR